MTAARWLPGDRSGTIRPMSESKKSGVMVPILAGAIVALILSITRLWGEMQTWSAGTWQAFVFNREAGGGNSPLSAAWLSVLWSFFIGRAMAKGGSRPASGKKAALLHVIAIAIVVGLMALMVQGGLDVIADVQTRILTVNGAAFVIGLLALVAWPKSWATLGFFGFLVHLPVLAIQFWAFTNATDTHYAKGPPFLTQEHWQFALTMAQLIFWPFVFTPLIGGFLAMLGAKTVKQ